MPVCVNFFNINVTSTLNKILSEFAKKNIGTTADDLISCRTSLDEFKNQMKLDDKAMTDANNVIISQGQMLLVNFVKANLGSTEDEAVKCKQDPSELQSKISISDSNAKPAFDIVNKQLADIDLRYRTVRGVVLPTREAADKSRKDFTTYKDLLSVRNDYKKKSDYLAHIEQVKALPVEKQVITKVVNDISTAMTLFEKDCKIAERYQYRLEHNNNRFWNGDVRSMVIRYAFFLYPVYSMLFWLKEKDFFCVVLFLAIIGALAWYMFWFLASKEKAKWEQITESGKYTLKELMDNTVSTSTAKVEPSNVKSVDLSK